MKKPFYTIYLIMLFCMTVLITSKANSNVTDAEKVDLLEAIEKISKEYEVYFTFDMTLVANLKVEYKHQSYGTAEDAIAAVLSGTDLKYQFYDQRFVIIFKEDAEGLESLKKMSRHLEGLISAREKNVASAPNRGLYTVPKLTTALMPRAIAPIAFSVEGKVTDQEGESLIGVNIQVKGTNKGTATDFDGNFTLNDIDENAVLVISYIGYQTQEVPVGGKSNLIITLASDSQLLDEVVVVGYGVKEKGQLTGSISTLNTEGLVKNRATDIVKGLQGTMPGLIIKDVGGLPGSEDAQILVRGTHTLGDNAPLFVVDGVPRGSISEISPYDIASISVLKDASAAIYGARAANGVILVTTKRGKEGKPVLQFNADYGVNALTRSPKLMSSAQYAIFRNEAFERLGQPKPYSDEDIEKYQSGSSPLTHPNTDWYRSTFKDYAPNENYNISISGGSQSIRYFVSGNYHNEKTLYASNDGRFSNYQLRSNIDIDVNEYLKIGADISLKLSESRMPPVPVANVTHGIWFNYPTEVDKYPNGLLGTVHEDYNTNVLSSFEAGYDKLKDKTFLPKLSVDLNMDWLVEGLSFKGYAGFGYVIGNNEYFKRPYFTYIYNADTEEYDTHVGTNPSRGYTSLGRTSEFNDSKLFNFQLIYNRRFGKHGFNAFVAHERSESFSEDISAGRRQLFSESKIQLYAGEEDGRSVGGNATETGRINYFGSVSYDFDRRFMADFTMRRDGSFNFPKDKRFGNFPSASIAWNMANESFMSRFSSFLSELKLRASYGIMGNDRIASYQYLTKFNTGTFAIFGQSPTYNPSISISSVPNPDITWEKAYTSNIGLDSRFFKNKLSVSFDYFYEKRRGILIRRSLSLPLYTAVQLPNENLGKVDSWGFETFVNYSSNLGEVNYSVGGNISFNRNKIVYMDEPINIPSYQKQEGFPVNSILAYEANGLFKNEQEVEQYPHLSGTSPGDIKYVDINNDGKIDDADRKRYYRTTTPEIQAAFNGSINFKGWNLFVMFQGQTNATTAIRINEDGGRPVEYFNDRWTIDNPNGKYPAATTGRSPYNLLSTYHFIDASYIRLKNIELGYDLSSMDWIGVNGFQQFSIFARARNLLTFDHVKLFDPEVPFQSDSSRGSRAKYYPQTISYSIGLNITF